MATPFKHILVPLDFTDKNTAAIETAKHLAAADKARVTLLHVIETIEYAEGPETDQFYADLKAQAERKLSEAQQRCAEKELTVDTRIIFGRRGPEIVRLVNDEAVDLLVVSSHKIDFAEPAKSWSTLSYQISVFCPCPVLLVK